MCSVSALSKLILEGPQGELTVTYNAQPALADGGLDDCGTISQQQALQPDYTAGHSLR